MSKGFEIAQLKREVNSIRTELYKVKVDEQMNKQKADEEAALAAEAEAQLQAAQEEERKRKEAEKALITAETKKKIESLAAK